MKKFNFKWLLLSIILSIASINTAWAYNVYVCTQFYTDYNKNSGRPNLYVDGFVNESSMTKLSQNWWVCDVGNCEGTAWVKRYYDANSYDTQFSVTVSPTNNVIFATATNAGNVKSPRHYDGATYVYWKVSGDHIPSWWKDDSRQSIQLRKNDNTVTGYVEGESIGENIYRYLVPEGDYVNIEFKRYSYTDYSGAFAFNDDASYNEVYDFGHNGHWGNWSRTYFAKNAYIYMDNTASGWATNSGYNHILIGRAVTSIYSITYHIGKISNTNLLCYDGAFSFNDYNQLCFIHTEADDWGEDKSTSPGARKPYAANHTNEVAYLMDGGSKLYNLFTPDGAGSGESYPTPSHSSASSYGDLLHSTQRVYTVAKTTGTYSETNSKAQISISSYKLSNATTSTTSSATLSTSESTDEITAVKTATTTLTCDNTIAAGYQFDGWYDAANGGTRLQSAKTYSYATTGATTVYARFSAKSYTITLNDGSGSGGDGTHSVTYDASVGNLTSAPTRTNYVFCGYETSGHVKIFNANLTPVSSVSGYTDGSGNWIYDGDITLNAIWKDKWNIKGSNTEMGGWSTYNGMPNVSSNTFQVTLSLVAGTTYDFKIVKRADGNSSNDVFYGKSGSVVFTRSTRTSAKGMTTTDGEQYNMQITADVSGSYDFTMYDADGTSDNMQLSIKYPCLSSGAGKVVYKFVVKSDVTEGNVCATDNTDYPQTIDGNKLSTLAGGTLTARGNGTESHLQYDDGSYKYSGSNFYLKVVTDCPLQTGDVIRYINFGASNSSVAMRLTENNSTNEIVLGGNGASTIQTATVTSSFNGQNTFYIDRNTNTSYLSYFEIIRPVTITLNASANEGKVKGENTIDLKQAIGDEIILPHALKSNAHFTGWYANQSGGDPVSTSYTVTGGTTLYAQWEDCPSSGTAFKFQVKSGLTNGATGITSLTDINIGNYVSILDGGQLSAYASNASYLSIAGTNSFSFENNGVYLKVDLDCALQTGDTIISTLANKPFIVNASSSGNSATPKMELATGTKQKTVVPAAMNNATTIYIWRKESNTPSPTISYFEIKRPAHYTITHDLTNVTKSSGATEVIHKAGYTATYTADDGYELPATISVTRGVTDITTNCTWSAGTVTIPAADCIGDITISVTGDEVSCSATADAGADKSTTVDVGVAMAATAASSGYTGAWSIKASSPSTDAGQLGTTSSNTMTFTPNQSGTYTLIWTVTDNSDGSCFATDEATVTVTRNTPTQYSVSGTATICSGGNTDITLEDSEEGASYQLMKGGVAEGVAKTGTGEALTWSVSDAGTYTVSAVQTTKYSARDMSASAVVNIYDAVSIGTQPTAAVNATVGQAASLSGLALASGTFNSAAYQWQTCNSDGSSASDITSGSAYDNYTTATLSFTPGSAGTYYFKCKVTDGCTNTVSSNVVTVTAKNQPAQYTVSGTASICSGDDTDITLSNSEDGVTYKLYKGEVDQSDDKVGDGDELTWTVSAAGTYTVKAEESSTYWERAMSGSATVSFKTATSISTQPATAVDATVNEDFTLGSALVAAGDGTLQYQWFSYSNAAGTDDETSVRSASTTKTYTTSKAAAGTYYYRVKVIGGCGTVASNVIAVTVAACSPTTLVKTVITGYESSAFQQTTTGSYAGTSIIDLTSKKSQTADLDSDGNNEIGYKMDDGKKFYVQLSGTTLQAGDIIKVGITKANDNYKDPATSDNKDVLIICAWNGSAVGDSIGKITGVSGAGFYTYTVKAADLTRCEGANDTIHYVGLARSRWSQNPYMYSIEVLRPCDETFAITEGAHTNGTIAITDGSSAITEAEEGATVHIEATGNTGYAFSSWTVTGDESEDAISLTGTNPATFTMPAEAVTVAATFTANTYTLTLDKNGGSADGTATATYNQHSLASITDATCALTNYTLGGYYTEADGGVLLVTASGSPRNLSAEDASHDAELATWLSPYTGRNWIYDDDITLYAHWWTSLFLNPNTEYHGTGTTQSAKAIYNGSALEDLPSTTGEDGYTLMGYYTTADGGTKVLNADGTFAAENISGYISGGKWIYSGASFVTLYAHWAQLYTVTYDGNGKTSGTVPPAIEDQSFGTEITVAGNTGTLAKTGYTFVGWNTAANGSGSFYAVGSKFTLTGNMTLYAQWADCGGTSCETWSGSPSDFSDDEMIVGTNLLLKNNGCESKSTAIYDGSGNVTNIEINNNSDYIEGHLIDGSTITSVTVSAATNQTESKEYAIVFSTSSSFSSTVTVYTHSAPAYNAARNDENLIHEFTAPANTKYFRLYRSFTYDEATHGSGKTMRVYGIEACKTGGGCTTYTVSFADMTGFEGSSTLPSNITGVLSGSKIAEPVIPSATGYVFGGWYKDDDCTDAWDFDTDEVTAATTLYAKWVDVSGKYTFHYGGGEASDNTWMIIPFTQEGTSSYYNIEDFIVPNTSKYPSFFVGYEGKYDTENAKSAIYEWDATYGSEPANGRMPIRHNEALNQSNCPLSADGQMADGAKGNLRIFVYGDLSTNCYVGFYPSGFALDWERGTTVLHSTTNPKVFETDVVTLTADEAAGNFEVKLATNDANEFVAYGRTATETAEGHLNGRKVAGEDYDIEEGAVGRFQINLSKKDNNFGLRFVPLVNRTTTSGNWETDDNWTLWRRPNIKETAYVAHSTTIKTPTAQVKNVIVDKTSGVGYPKLYIDSDNDGVGGLLVENHIQVLKMVDETPTLSDETTYSELEINSSADGSGALIMGDASTTTAANTALYTKAVYNGVYGWVNQYIGTPSASGSIYDFYGTYLYVYSPVNSSWVQANRQPSSAMPTFKAYNLMREESDPGIYTFYDPLVFPGITEDKLKVLTCDDENDETAPEANRVGAYMFANSWTAPIDVKAMETSDFDGANATIYIFNAGSPAQAESAGDPSQTAEDPGQWVSIPVNAAPYLPENLTVIPSMQAFRIVTTNATASLTLDYKKHVYDPAKNRTEGIEIKPLRAPKHNDARPNILKLFVEAASGYRDNLYLFERQDFSETFDNGWDGSKMFGISAAPQIYGVNGELKTSINAIPDLEGQQVGFMTGKADSEYTITFNYEGDDTWFFNDTKEHESTLISNDAEYTFTTEPGEDSNRFYISASPIQKVPTSIENPVTDPQNSKVRKVIINDHIYIIHGGRMYDATGKMLK